MSVSRRDVMKLFGATGLAAIAGRAQAQSAAVDPERMFLFLYFAGGWDHTQSLDPRPPGLDANKEQTGIEMGWDDLPAGFSRSIIQPPGSSIGFGPSIGALADHFGKLCVVRGMSMDTLTHEVGYRYFLTGKPPSGLTPRGSSMGSLIVDQLAGAQPTKVRELANFTLDIDSYYTGARSEAKAFRGSSKSTIAVGASFRRTLLPGAAPGTLGDMILATTAHGDNQLLAHRRRAPCDAVNIDASGAMTAVRRAQTKNESMFASPLLSEFDLSIPVTALKSLRYGPNRAALPTAGTPGLAAFFARQALASGLANVVTATIQDDLDTHTQLHATQHATRLKAGFDAVGELIRDLEETNHPTLSGRKLLDHTTIVIFSEFSRTARLNGARGRDHSLTNSCVLLGAGIRGNRVIGASSDFGMQPQPVNLSDGSVATSGQIIKPAHVLATVLDAAGYDRSSLLEEPITAARV